MVDFVATAASGVDMNDAGLVIGTSYPDPGCGSSCLPPLETVVWRDGSRTVVPDVPGLGRGTVTGINNHGWIVGHAGSPARAVVWKPEVVSGMSTYLAIVLGTLPGRTTSAATGVDDLGRVVGWSTTTTFPPSGAPFMWTEAGGMVDLTEQGFPNEAPLGISPGGTVATYGFWYRLGHPEAVSALPAAPAGLSVDNSRVAINDAGDQARFLVTAVHPYLVYPFRFNRDGHWQQISTIPTGHLSTYSMGSINDARDITVTVASTGMVARGPSGQAQPLAPLVSAAYAGADVTAAGPMNARGEILARMMIGRSARLVRLIPAQPCVSNCVRVTSLQMEGWSPAYCDQGSNQVQIRLTVASEAGVPLGGVRVTARILDDYWMDRVVVGQTDSGGILVLEHAGPACVGAIAALVSDATSGTEKRTLDHTAGTLTAHVIPQPRPWPQAGESSTALPGYVLGSFTPNPARSSTRMRFSVPEPVAVTLVLYNALGREVAQIARDLTRAGSHEIVVETTGLSNGVYLARFAAGTAFQQTVRLVVAR